MASLTFKLQKPLPYFPASDQETVATVDLEQLQKALADGGDIMRMIKQKFSKLCREQGLSMTGENRLEIISEDSGYLQIAFNVLCPQQDAFNAIQDLIGMNFEQTIGQAKQLIQRSIEMSRQGQLHEITTDPSRKDDPGALYCADTDASDIARMALKSPSPAPIDFVVNGRPLIIERPQLASSLVIGSTQEFSIRVTVVSLSIPTDKSTVDLVEVGSKKRHRVSYTEELFPLLMTALTTAGSGIYLATIEPVVAIGDQGNPTRVCHLKGFEFLCEQKGFDI